MKHALFIVFHYPPEASSSGVLRTLKFSRYLPEMGWRITVITLREDAYEVCDRRMLQQIPADVSVVRTRYINTARHLSLFGRYPALLAIPDRWIGWLPFALTAAAEIMRDDPADLVFSTSPHATAHLIAKRISTRYRLPWVADFRDPWFEDPPEPGTPAVVHWAARHLERSAIRVASAVVTSTEHLARMLASRYPMLPATRFTAILNGYDEEDFKALDVGSSRPAGRLRLLHAGEINAHFRDPRPLFSAVRALIDRSLIREDEIEISFIGGGAFAESTVMADAISGSGLAEVVRQLPRMPYADALHRMADADCLLLLQASEDTRELVPAKLYEYMRLQRPVLALVLPGVTAEIVTTAHAGWTVDPGAQTALQQSLTELISCWRSGELSSRVADLNFLRRFERRSLTGELAACFERVLTEHGARSHG